MLYWQYFYQIVKYRTLIDKFLNGEILFIHISPGKFRNLIQIIIESEGKDLTRVKNKIMPVYNSIINFRNM